MDVLLVAGVGSLCAEKCWLCNGKGIQGKLNAVFVPPRTNITPARLSWSFLSGCRDPFTPPESMEDWLNWGGNEYAAPDVLNPWDHFRLTAQTPVMQFESIRCNHCRRRVSIPRPNTQYRWLVIENRRVFSSDITVNTIKTFHVA